MRTQLAFLRLNDLSIAGWSYELSLAPACAWKGQKMLKLFRMLHEDKSGAAFIEYTALLGVILAVGLALLTTVGTWASDTWTYLCNKLNNTNAACVPPAA